MLGLKLFHVSKRGLWESVYHIKMILVWYLKVQGHNSIITMLAGMLPPSDAWLWSCILLTITVGMYPTDFLRSLMILHRSSVVKRHYFKWPWKSDLPSSWWRHQMETFSASLALCAPVNSPHKGQWRGALIFILICTWINDWVKNREAGDLRRFRAHYDVIVMMALRFGYTIPA